MIQVAVLNRFSWIYMVGASSHMGEPYFLRGNNRSNRTTDMGENVSIKQVFCPSFSRCGGFSGKNFKTIFGTPFPIEKVIFIFVIRHPIPCKMASPPQKKKKIIFHVYFGKKYKKIVIWKIFKTSFLTKKFILITSSIFSCSKVYSLKRKFYGE